MSSHAVAIEDRAVDRNHEAAAPARVGGAVRDRRKLRVLDLFSGIGGFALGLDATGGFETVAFCEVAPYPRAVLAEHWPGVPIYDDVRTLTGDVLARDGIAVDVICGGFPCQDLSFAGKRAGLEGARSGLWGEYARIIRELRPAFVVVENVPGLLSPTRDAQRRVVPAPMGAVLGDLAALGYDAVWDCVSAASVGAPHRRDRIWIVAYAERGRQPRRSGRHAEPAHARAPSQDAADAVGIARDARGAGDAEQSAPRRDARRARRARDVADAGGEGWIKRDDAAAGLGHGRVAAAACSRAAARDADDAGLAIGQGERGDDGAGLAIGQGERGDDGAQCPPALGADWWAIEPGVGRVAHGVPARVDRLKGLGNAVVPTIPFILGRAILAALEEAESGAATDLDATPPSPRSGEAPTGARPVGRHSQREAA